MTIIADQRERVGEFVSKKINGSRWYEYQAIGIEKDGDIIAGVVIDGYVKSARCSIHCAGEGKRWLTRAFLAIVFDYVFRQIDCKVIVNTVNSSNKDSMRFTSHLGFKEVARIAGGYVDGDLVIFTLNKEDCRWL